MREVLAIIGALIAMFSTLPYIFDIVKGHTKPNIVSWFTWSLLTAIAMAAAFAAHQPRTGLLMLGSTICTMAVVVLGLKYGIAKYTRFDVLCQFGALLGLAFWLLFNSPVIGIIVPVVIDFFAAMPTFRHAWVKPEEETWQTFLIGVVAASLTVVSLTKYDVAGLLYPSYLVVANGLIALAVISRRLYMQKSLIGHSVHQTLHE